MKFQNNLNKQLLKKQKKKQSKNIRIGLLNFNNFKKIIINFFFKFIYRIKIW